MTRDVHAALDGVDAARQGVANALAEARTAYAATAETEPLRGALAEEIVALEALERGRSEAEAESRRTLEFVSAGDLLTSAPPEPPWVWRGYAAKGAVTLLAGKPKAGKSTLALALTEAVAAGAPHFLEKAISGGPVVYVSEEGAGTLGHKLPRSEAVRVLTRDLAWPKPAWRDLVSAVVAEAARVGAVLAVVDTLSFWGALPAEREKDAGAAQEVMEPLIEAAGEELAIVLLHHQRKGGGEDGEAIRGSGALAGAADVLLELERPSGDKAPPRQRVLFALGRYPGTPAALVIDHDAATGAWGLVAEGSDRGAAGVLTARAAVLAAIKAAGGEITRSELEDAAGDVRQWKPVLNGLIEDGVVGQSGKGVKGDPHRYRILSPDSVEDGPQKDTERVIVEADLSAVCPVGAQQNQLHGVENREAVDPTESGAGPRPHRGSVWTDADVPGERLRVLAVEGDVTRLRVESSNGRGGEELEVPLAAFGADLRRVS